MPVSVGVIDPLNGLPLDRRATWVVEVEQDGDDPDPRSTCTITVRYPGLGRDEVVWDGIELRPGFRKRSREEQVSSTAWRLHVAPDRGWPDKPTFWIVPIDPDRINGDGSTGENPS